MKPVEIDGKTHIDCVEQVLGNELKTGHIVFILGYSYRVWSVERQQERYVCELHWSEVGKRPPTGAERLDSGLRADMKWSRVKPSLYEVWRQISNKIGEATE